MPEIALECKPDEVLAKALGYTRKRIVHQPSNSEVINYLRKNPGNIGTPPYLRHQLSSSSSSSSSSIL